jgi:hypothetical protein
MKDKILLIAVIVLQALLMSAGAADIFGTWIECMPGSKGTVDTIFSNRLGDTIFSNRLGDTIFSFAADGKRLTGTVSGPQGRFVINDGKIRGDKIYFVVIHNSAGKEWKVVYKGKVSLNEIKFTREFQGVKMKPLEFIARREFQRHNDYIPRPIRVPVKPLPDR